MAFSDSRYSTFGDAKDLKNIFGLSYSNVEPAKTTVTTIRIQADFWAGTEGKGHLFPDVGCDGHRAEFLNLGTVDIWGWVIFCCGALRH